MGLEIQSWTRSQKRWVRRTLSNKVVGGFEGEFAELNDLPDEEESKAPPKKAAARQPDANFEAAMGQVGSSGDQDDIELEDKYHDIDAMESMSVIEHEMDYLTKFAKTIKDKDERDFYLDKVESLKFKKSTIESNIGNGYVTPESYLKSVKGYLAVTEKALKQASASLGTGNKHVTRLQNRV